MGDIIALETCLDYAANMTRLNNGKRNAHGNVLEAHPGNALAVGGKGNPNNTTSPTAASRGLQTAVALLKMQCEGIKSMMSPTRVPTDAAN